MDINYKINHLFITKLSLIYSKSLLKFVKELWGQVFILCQTIFKKNAKFEEKMLKFKEVLRKTTGMIFIKLKFQLLFFNIKKYWTILPTIDFRISTRMHTYINDDFQFYCIHFFFFFHRILAIWKCIIMSPQKVE